MGKKKVKYKAGDDTRRVAVPNAHLIFFARLFPGQYAGTSSEGELSLRLFMEFTGSRERLVSSYKVRSIRGKVMIDLQFDTFQEVRIESRLNCKAWAIFVKIKSYSRCDTHETFIYSLYYILLQI